MSLIDQLPKEKQEECKLIFDLYDSSKKGVISTDLVEKLCKNLGAYVPSDDIKDFKENYFDEGVVNFNQFMAFFAEHYLKKIDRQQLISAFQFLDKGKTGNINTKELKHWLMVVGDKLTEKEADDLLKDFDKNGVIDYRIFAGEISK